MRDEEFEELRAQLDAARTRPPTYADRALAEIDAVMPGVPAGLTHLYAVLALVTGQATTLENVHDAWSIWRAVMQPDHPAIVPFADLPPEKQELDRPYAEGIHRAAQALASGRPPAAAGACSCDADPIECSHKAARAEAEETLAEVRRLCEMTIASSCRLQAIHQAEDTLRILNRRAPSNQPKETPTDA